jgi:hypothetical protein
VPLLAGELLLAFSLLKLDGSVPLVAEELSLALSLLKFEGSW